MKKILLRVFITNAKTTACAVLAIVAVVGRFYKLIDREEMQYLMGIAIAGGLFAAKDGVRDEPKVAPESTQE